MGKSSKRKKNRVPKITEAEYAAYLSALKVEEGENKPTDSPCRDGEGNE
jgi:hypothetical protein